MAGVAGFEPTDDGVRVRCLTVWRYPYVHLVVNGVEYGIRTHDLRNHNPTL